MERKGKEIADLCVRRVDGYRPSDLLRAASQAYYPLVNIQTCCQCIRLNERDDKLKLKCYFHSIVAYPKDRLVGLCAHRVTKKIFTLYDIGLGGG